jgi:hypothetical protein
MSLSILSFVIAAEALFLRAPGHEKDDTMYPGEQSLYVISEGAGNLLNSGFVTLFLLPALAALLYFSGYRIAGPMLALLAAGLFLARMFGAPA